MGYSEYIHSVHWKQKSSFLKDLIGRCEICGKSKPYLHVHHIHYKKDGLSILGYESISDLLVVCPKCHKLIHNYLDFVKSPIHTISFENTKLIQSNPWFSLDGNTVSSCDAYSDSSIVGWLKYNHLVPPTDSRHDIIRAKSVKFRTSLAYNSEDIIEYKGNSLLSYIQYCCRIGLLKPLGRNKFISALKEMGYPICHTRSGNELWVYKTFTKQ